MTGTNHDFTLVLSDDPSLDLDDDQFLDSESFDEFLRDAESFGEPTVSLRSGKVHLCFTVSAPSFDEAVAWAMDQVKRARPMVNVSLATAD